jgi:hypothetical protein
MTWRTASPQGQLKSGHAPKMYSAEGYAHIVVEIPIPRQVSYYCNAYTVYSPRAPLDLMTALLAHYLAPLPLLTLRWKY